MKKVITLILIYLSLFAKKAESQNFSIDGTGALPDPSAMLDESSTDKGLLIPRTDTTSVNPSTPAEGLKVYQNTDDHFYFYDGMKWAKRSSVIENLDSDTHIDVEKNQDEDNIRFKLGRGSSTPRISAPSSSAKGMVYYNDLDNKIYYWNGSTWKALAVE